MSDNTDSRRSLIASILGHTGVCPCGRTHAVSLRALIMERGALERLPEVLHALGDVPATAMICDENTYKAAGAAVERILADAGMPLSQVVCLPAAHLHATDVITELTARLLRPCDRLIAVGSGTVHDITRYTATARGIDFVSVPTAASVDGYVSSVAAMTWHGVKRTFPAKPPVAMVADSGVIAAAPARLTASGVGDLLGKYTSLFDWRASHLLTGEYICEDYIIPLVEDALESVVRQADAVSAGDTDAVEAVMYGLTLSGLAMQMVGNSRPASGAEHHISHLIEMNVLGETDGAMHGEKVGVAEVMLCGLYRDLLSRPLSPDDVPPYRGFSEADVRRVFGSRADEVIDNENTPDPLFDVDRRVLLDKWDDLRGLAERTLPAPEKVRSLLAACGAPVTLDEIGVDASLEDTLYRFAPYVRRRLTFLRLAGMIQKKKETEDMDKQNVIGIIGAMNIEVEALWAAMENKTETVISGITFAEGTLCGRRVVVSKCGIGKVFAAICAQTMILTYHPSLIVNTGVAGTLTDRLSIGQVALADKLVQHDMDTSPIGDPVGLLSGINVVYLPTDAAATACLASCVTAEGGVCAAGTVASGDQFICSTAQKDLIRSRFENVVACEMEGASIGHVCYVNGTPCAILRAISDGGDESAFADYPAFVRHAAAQAARVLMRFLNVWGK